MNANDVRFDADLPIDVWKLAIDDGLVIAGIGTADSFPDARTALAALIDWHVMVALDPTVSLAARALIDQGKLEARFL